jgi:thymidylate synthase
MMIACVTGLEPGVFTHFVANEQIYDRHIDNAHEMLRRAEELERQDAVSAQAGGDGDSAQAGNGVSSQIKGSVTSQLMDADSAQAGCSISAPPENTEDFSAGRQPSLILHKEKGCRFEDITIDDFEMRDYTPMKPQLKFELGI